jgi:hypothetical protein
MELKLNYSETKKVVYLVLKGGRTPAIWGPPGIGKSSLGREVAAELGAKLYILDAPLLQPFDYAVAVPDHATKTVQLYPTGFLPQSGPAVVLVEDLPHAKPYQMIPLMQIVLDRRIGHLYFENNVHFIITGNREEDLAGVNPLPSPLLNRLVHINMNVDVEEWLKWAVNAGIHEDLVGFLRVYPQHLLHAPEENVKAWPTPRTWHMLSDILEQSNGDLDTFRLISDGCIGSSVTMLLMAWLRYLRQIDPRLIVEKGQLPSVSNREQIYAVSHAVAGLLKTRADYEKYISTYKNNIVAFFRWLQGEMKVAFLKELASVPDVKVAQKLLIKLNLLDPIFSQYITELIQGGKS